MSLKSTVEAIWSDAGSLNWDYQQTLSACIDADKLMRQQGRNPARRFREELDRGNQEYMRQWVMGCHFNWLNPR